MQRYRGDIDGLRALSVLAVVFFHAGLGVPGGFVGVDVFFVISGFLITGLIRDGLDSGSFSLAQFWERRIRRIWPAALVTTAAVLIAGWFIMLPRDYRDLGSDAVAQILMLANVRFWLGTDYFAAASDLRPLLHMWSLAVEEQFYIFYPPFLWVMWRYARSWVVGILVLTSVMSLAASVLAVRIAPSAGFYLLPFRAWELQLGGLLAIVPLGRQVRPIVGDLLCIAGLVGIAACCFLYDRSTPFPGVAAIPVCVGSALVIWGGTDSRAIASRILAWQPLRVVGLISYSLYLCHWPIFAFMRYRFGEELPVSVALSGVALSVMIAAASYWWLEGPMRRGCPSWRIGRVALMAVAMSLPIFAAAVSVRYAYGFPSRVPATPAGFHARQELPRQWELRSSEPSTLSLPIGATRRASDCPCFLFLGDSHGMAISKVIDDASRNRGVGGEASLRGAFAPLLGVWRPGALAASADFRSHEIFDGWLRKELRRCKPRHIILCARWSGYLSDDKTDIGFGDSMGIASRLDQTSSANDRAGQMRRSIEELLDLTAEDGAQIWFLLEVPRQDITPQRRAILGMHEGAIPLQGVSVDDHNARVSEVRSIFESLASSRLHVVDLSRPFFGADGLSRVGRDAESWYMDDDHVSTAGAQELLGATIGKIFDEISADCAETASLMPDSGQAAPTSAPAP